ERVVWIWGAILESAAEIDDGGRYDVDPAEIAYFLRADQDDVDAVVAGLADAGRVAEGCVVKWGNRQFASDRSKDRVAAHRERKRAENGGDRGAETSRDGDVTLQKRHRNSPEAETETDTEVIEAAPQCARAPAQPISEAVADWNASAVRTGWPTILKQTPGRQTAMRDLLRAEGLDGWRNALARAERSPFLGRSPPSWFTFDFIVKPGNFAKLIEGNYDHGQRNGHGSLPGSASGFGRTVDAAQRFVSRGMGGDAH
ncbi:MAG: hypothetical protein ACK4S3_06155, partial [Parvibaculum sp.]